MSQPKDGRDGRSGKDGRNGEPGFPGTAGKVGPVGPKGDKGDPGLHGNDGARGEAGATGEVGPVGQDGAQGLKGDPGDIGPMPLHRWDGNKLQFEEAPGKWGKKVDLIGPPGKAGITTVVGRGGSGAGNGGTSGPPGAMGPAGPQGPPGSDSGDSGIAIFSAGEPISGHRAVCMDVTGHAFYAQLDDDASGVAGVSVTAASVVNDPVSVRLSGSIDEQSWNWSPGPIYLGPNGTLTQSPDDDENLVELGVALSSTSMLVRVQIAIFEE